MREILFWTLFLAGVLAGTSALIGSGVSPFAASYPLQGILGENPLPDRAPILGLGLTAVAITYRHAWLSLKAKAKVAP